MCVAVTCVLYKHRLLVDGGAHLHYLAAEALIARFQVHVCTVALFGNFRIYLEGLHSAGKPMISHAPVDQRCGLATASTSQHVQG